MAVEPYRHLLGDRYMAFLSISVSNPTGFIYVSMVIQGSFYTVCISGASSLRIDGGL